MQRAEMEELRQREANLTALQAIGPRKKPKLDTGSSTNNPGGSASVNASASGMNRPMPMRPRVKRVNFRDLLFLLEQEKESCRSTTLYKAYLKWCSVRGRNASDRLELASTVLLCYLCCYYCCYYYCNCSNDDDNINNIALYVNCIHETCTRQMFTRIGLVFFINSKFIYWLLIIKHWLLLIDK